MGIQFFHPERYKLNKQKERTLIIRNETINDKDAIAKITLEAFKNVAVSQQTEAFIINALRREGALTLSLVADIKGEIVGHIAFSPVIISDQTQNWFGLGPVSVKPELQKKGIGKQLIQKGLALLKEMGAGGCALVGDPNYYQFFGFKNDKKLIHDGIPQEVFLVLPFHEKVPVGSVIFHNAFQATS